MVYLNYPQLSDYNQVIKIQRQCYRATTYQQTV